MISTLAHRTRRDRVTLAAVIMEPFVEVLADVEWLRELRAHCDHVGAVLIFDEVKTGFRLARGGAQALLGVTPDLTTLGKALANGYPLAAVVGVADVMAAAERTWISSTLATELTAIAAAHAVLDQHERARCVRTTRSRWARIARRNCACSGAVRLHCCTTTGHDTMFILRWRDDEIDGSQAGSVASGRRPGQARAVPVPDLCNVPRRCRRSRRCVSLGAYALIMPPRHLIDAHAHFHWSGSRNDFARYNASRLRAGDMIGITVHVASILGTWGRTSPTYFASPARCARRQ